MLLFSILVSMLNWGVARWCGVELSSVDVDVRRWRGGMRSEKKTFFLFRKRLLMFLLFSGASSDILCVHSQSCDRAYFKS